MRNYTLRLVTAPVQRGAWDAHYGFLDAVPGASLLENPAAPEIVLDLDPRSGHGKPPRRGPGEPPRPGRHPGVRYGRAPR